MIEARKETNMQYRVRAGRSSAGLGLFAEEAIPKGKRIIEYVGNILTDVSDEDTPNNLYIFNISRHVDIDGSPRWNIARYANHSCRPNAESAIKKGHVWLVAKRNIAPGEEICYDYGKEYWNEYIKPKGCRCVKCVEKREKQKEKTGE